MPPVLNGPRVTLRPHVEADIEVRLALGRDPEIHRMYGGSRADLRPLTRDGIVDWYRRLSALPCGWVIEHGRLIGEVRLDNVNSQDRRASLAIGIADRTALGQGLGYGGDRLGGGLRVRQHGTSSPCRCASSLSTKGPYAPIKGAAFV